MTPGARPCPPTTPWPPPSALRIPCAIVGGYVYDSETGLYYLTSRYYNPVWGRFINADTPEIVVSSPGKVNWDKNFFAYCDNNPISRKDDGGEFWHIIAAGAINNAVTQIHEKASVRL